MREALEVARDGARTPHEMERKNGRLTVCAYVLITTRRFLNNYGCMTLMGRLFGTANLSSVRRGRFCKK